MIRLWKKQRKNTESTRKLHFRQLKKNTLRVSKEYRKKSRNKREISSKELFSTHLYITDQNHRCILGSPVSAIYAFRTGKDNGTGHDLFILELEDGLVDLYLFGCFYWYLVETTNRMFCYSYQHGTLDLSDKKLGAYVLSLPMPRDLLLGWYVSANGCQT